MTGKTLAFVLPIVERLLRDVDYSRQSKQCRVLVLEPTRELAKQVNEEIIKLVGNKVSTLTIYGGTPYEPQTRALQRGVDIVIATPGRLIDHLDRGNIDLSHIQTAVLDESDEMLRMGFVEPVEQILSTMPKEKQTLLFSATMPRWVKGIAGK